MKCPDKTLKIMCIGDSITQGSAVQGGGELSYKYPLWKKLIDSDVNFEFVGSRNFGFEGTPEYEDYKGLVFPNIHEGYWGWTIQGVAPEVINSLKNGNIPDVAVINLGSNSVKTTDENGNIIEETVAEKKAAMCKMIDDMRAEKSNLKFILAGPFNTWFAELRQAYAELASEKTSVDSPIILTKQPSVFIDDPEKKGSYTNDWVHTSPIGDEVTAQIIFETLKNFV